MRLGYLRQQGANAKHIGLQSLKQLSSSMKSSNEDQLLPGSRTFTPETVRTQLLSDTFVPDGNGTPPVLLCDRLEVSYENGSHRYFTAEEQAQKRQSLCRSLFEVLSDPSSQFCKQLDALSSQIAHCNLPPQDKVERVVTDTCELLKRLPARPLPLPDVPRNMNGIYHNQTMSEAHRDSSLLWDELSVVSHLSVNVIRTALLVTIEDSKAIHVLVSLLDTVADLLSTATQLSLSGNTESELHTWFLVRAYLWTSWQRCTMIYFHTVLGNHLRDGFNDAKEPALLLKGTSPSPDITLQDISRHQVATFKPQSMCGWAFELLRSNPVCLASDFRGMFSRYAKAFGDRTGRCIRDQASSCKGDDSAHCQRFKGMKIEDQSAHDESCQGHCDRLVWDEKSYREVSGARAVTLNDSADDRHLAYCQASAKTLAISHVWSHGQGGRPEEGSGFNRCLHRRYVSIARTLGCDSYWMDTPCIPEDHQLRREAIMNINQVFDNSRATIICDRDLMSIDTSNLTIAVWELILVTILVCDWNIRAWTFLEAFRGRAKTFALCKGNTPVSIRDTIDAVHREGSLSITPLLLTLPHLQPSFYAKEKGYTNGFPYSRGFLVPEVAGSLLCYRPASRPGDDIVIWSLLLQDEVCHDAESFWRSREGSTLATSFLMSSAPRLGKRGLRWAPSSPMAGLMGLPTLKTKTRILAFDGSDSAVGSISSEGFTAPWWFYDFVGPYPGNATISNILGVKVNPEDAAYRRNLSRIRRTYLKGCLWGALLRPIRATTSRQSTAYRGDSSKTYVAVCGTNKRVQFYIVREPEDQVESWQWKGLYQWDMSEPLPRSKRAEVLLD